MGLTVQGAVRYVDLGTQLRLEAPGARTPNLRKSCWLRSLRGQTLKLTRSTPEIQLSSNMLSNIPRAAVQLYSMMVSEKSLDNGALAANWSQLDRL